MLVRTHRSSGFSLVEVLLVIVIILMLAGALVVYVLPQQEGAQRNTTRLKLTQIEQGLNMYKTNVGVFPNEEQGGLSALLRKPGYENEKLGERWAGPYLKRGTALDDAWGNALQYEMVDPTLTDDPTAPDYRLYSVGPDGQPDTDDDIHLFEANPLDIDGSVMTEDVGTAPATTPAATPGTP